MDKHRRCSGSGTAYGGPVALYLFQNLKNFLAQRVNLNLDKFSSHLGSLRESQEVLLYGTQIIELYQTRQKQAPRGLRKVPREDAWENSGV